MLVPSNVDIFFAFLRFFSLFVSETRKRIYKTNNNMKKELTRLHSNAAALCSSRWRKQCVHLLLLKMFGENLRQSAVREPIITELNWRQFRFKIMSGDGFPFSIRIVRDCWHRITHVTVISIPGMDFIRWDTKHVFSIWIFSNIYVLCRKSLLTTTWRNTIQWLRAQVFIPTSTTSITREDYYYPLDVYYVQKVNIECFSF